MDSTLGSVVLLAMFQFNMLLFQMLVRYFPLFLLAVGKLSFLAKLLGEDPGFNYTKVGLASRHVHQDPDADQHEVSDAGQQEGNLGRHLRNITSLWLPLYNSEKPSRN